MSKFKLLVLSSLVLFLAGCGEEDAAAPEQAVLAAAGGMGGARGGSELPACSAEVGADHYCADRTKAACWSLASLVAGIAAGDKNARATGAAGCSVETHPSAGVTESVECMAGCNDPAVPLPAVTVAIPAPPDQGFAWCHSLDAAGLEQAVCGKAKPAGYAASPYPPFVLHCLPSCS